MSGKRRSFTPQFKARLALEVLQGQRTAAEIAADHQLNPAMLKRWRDELTEKASVAFDAPGQTKERKRRELALDAQRDELLKALGTATVERDWLRRIYSQVSGGAQPPELGQMR